jgi:branched-chain amino acid transport system permease protein
VVGGAATITGPAIGAFLVVFIPIWLHDFDAPAELSPIVFGVSLILLIMVAPGGVLGLVRRLNAWVKRRTARPTEKPPPAPSAEALASGP